MFTVEEELRIRGDENHGFVAPLTNSTEDYMNEINERRRNELYPHSCHPDCEARGCPYVTSLDGIWKLR